MYRELSPLLDELRAELQSTLPDTGLAVDRERLLDAYVERFILYIGADISNNTITAVALDSSGEVLASLDKCVNEPKGFAHFRSWVEHLRTSAGARIVVVAAESTGVYYEEFWRYLARDTNYARTLYNPRTTAHMAEVTSVKVRDDITDAYLLAEQIRLGSTPESHPHQDEDLLIGRDCARIVRGISKEVNRKKNQLKALLRTFNPALYRALPGAKLYSRVGIALLRHYPFPQDIVAAGQRNLETLLAENGRGDASTLEAAAILKSAKACYGRPGRREVTRLRINDLLDDIQNLKRRKRSYLKLGYGQIETRPETPLLRAVYGAGPSITLGLISESGDASRFRNGDQLASFLGLTTSKHVSGTSLYVTKGITKQGSPVGRYAAVKLADFLRRNVPQYTDMYNRIKARKPPRKGHFVALVAIARHFVSNVLYDMLIHHRPFFTNVEDYRAYRRTRLKQGA